MDDTDRKLIALLKQDARMSLAQLARRLGIARSTAQARLDRLENSGAIAGYTLRLGDHIRANRIRATVLLTIDARAQAATLPRLRAIPQIETIHTTSGRFDLLLSISAETTTALDGVLDAIGDISGVKSSESLIHLSTKLDRGP